MTNKTELFDKIKKMSLDECWVYHSSAKSTNSVINILGIGIFLVIIFMPSLLTIIPGAILLYILGNLSSGISLTLKHLEERILTLDPHDE